MANSAEHARDLENYLRGVQLDTPPTSLFIGLVDADDDELSYPGYSREEINANQAVLGTNGTPLSNQGAITVPGPTSGGPHAQAVKGRAYKGATGSAYWFDGTLTEPKTPVNGQDFVIPIGGMTHTESPAP